LNFYLRGSLACFAVRAVRSGRRVAGVKRRESDVLNPCAARRRGFTVSRLPNVTDTLSVNPFTLALADHGEADPADHAAFRCDWPAFLNSQDRREVRMAEQLGRGDQAKEVAPAPGPFRWPASYPKGGLAFRFEVLK